MIPTHRIEKDRFMQIMAEAGQAEELELFSLAAYNFTPPLMDGGQWDPEYELPQHTHIVFADVPEPMIYKPTDEDDPVPLFIINPNFEMNYENFQDYHYVKGAWSYVLAPHFWDMFDFSDDLDDAVFTFAPQFTEGTYDVDNVATH